MKEKTKTVLKNHFSATHIAYMALFTALAYVVTFLEFPIFPAAPYLKLDFANVFFMIEGFIFGPVEAIISIIIKELLCFTKTSSGGAGEIANFLMSTAYIIIPSIAYRFKKGRWWVALYLVFGCALQIAVSLPANRYINFVVFMGENAARMFADAWPYVLGFNAIKSVAVSIVVFLIYKPLSRFIKMTREKLSKRRKKRATEEKLRAKEEKRQAREEKRRAKAEKRQAKKQKNQPSEEKQDSNS